MIRVKNERFSRFFRTVPAIFFVIMSAPGHFVPFFSKKNEKSTVSSFHKSGNVLFYYAML